MHILSHFPFYMLVSIVWYLYKNVLIYLFVCLFYIPATVSLPISLPNFSLHPPPVLTLQSTPPQFLFRKEQISHEYQQNMTYKTAGELSTSI